MSISSYVNTSDNGENDENDESARSLKQNPQLLKHLRKNSSKFFKSSATDTSGRTVTGRLQFAAHMKFLENEESGDSDNSNSNNSNSSNDGGRNGVHFSATSPTVDVEIGLRACMKAFSVGASFRDGEEAKAAVSPTASFVATPRGFTGTFEYANAVVPLENEEMTSKLTPDENSSNSSKVRFSKVETKEEKLTIAETERKALKRMASTKVQICLEIENCDLKISKFSHLRYINPFVVMKLNGKEIGRTPAIKGTNQPIWRDEIYEFPACVDCDKLTFEVWNMKATSLEIGKNIGAVSLDINAMRRHHASKNEKDFLPYELYLYRESEDDDDVHSHCQCPYVDEEKIVRGESKQNDKHDETNIKNVRLNPMKWMESMGSSIRSNGMTKPGQENGKKFKLEDIEEYKLRRRDLRKPKPDEPHGPWYTSPTTKALGMIVGYMLVGVVAFSFTFEKKSWERALYLGVITFTTVGYGDEVPTSDGGKIFACFFAFMGIGIVGIALGYIGQHLVQVQAEAMKRRAEASGSTKQLVTPSENSVLYWKSALNFLFPIVLVIAIGSAFVGHVERWNVLDSIYWCIMTCTTVGYGDFSPTERVTTWFAIFFIPISVGTISSALGKIANNFVEREIEKTNTKLLQREVTIEDLNSMNEDDDDEVSPLEFIEHMLIVMQKVDRTFLDKLHGQFEKLDADGSGGLDQDDLEMITESKLEDRRKEALEIYRKSLLGTLSAKAVEDGTRPVVDRSESVVDGLESC